MCVCGVVYYILPTFLRFYVQFSAMKQKYNGFVGMARNKFQAYVAKIKHDVENIFIKLLFIEGVRICNIIRHTSSWLLVGWGSKEVFRPVG